MSTVSESREELAGILARGFNAHAMGGGDSLLSTYLADVILSSSWLEGERARARTEIRQALVAAWDAGNATGLDGWVGPGRGTDPVDDEAIRACERDVDRILSTIHTDGSERA